MILRHQSVDATINHAQGDGTRPTPAEQQQIVNFEMALSTAQNHWQLRRPIGRARREWRTRSSHHSAVLSQYQLQRQPFGSPRLKLPGGLVTPGDHGFTPAIFNPFDAWATQPSTSPRAAVARGQAIFNSRPINITGVAGINDVASAGGLVKGRNSLASGNFAVTCHDTPKCGQSFFPDALEHRDR